MTREELTSVLKQNDYFEGGTKEACIKAREFLRVAINLENQISLPTTLSCVTVDEFMNAVKTLIAFSYCQEDSVPEKWQCDSNCHRNLNIPCPGEFNIDKSAKKMCPFYIEDGLL